MQVIISGKIMSERFFAIIFIVSPKLDFELNGKCKDLVVMGWAGGFIIIDLKNDIILCFMKTKRTAAFTHLEERWKLENSSYQKIKVIGEKEDSHIVVPYNNC